MPKPGRMKSKTFRTFVRGLVAGLVLVVGLVTYNINIPKGRSTSGIGTSSSITRRSFSTSSSARLCSSGGRPVRLECSQPRPAWMAISAIGLAFVVLAFAMASSTSQA